MLKIGIIFLCSTIFTLGQVVFKNECNDVTTQSDFKAAMYVGVWYEIRRYETFFQLAGECVTAEYGLNPDGSISVNNTYRDKFGNYKSINGEARETNPGQNDGKFVVSFPGTPQGKYWVLGTDYTNFAVVWSCTQFEYCWILSRKPVANETVEVLIQNVLNKNKIYIPKFRQTKQDWYTCQRSI